MKNFGNSSFWIDDSTFTLEDVETTESDNLYKLASSKRAISNFVRILTNENIPVTYQSRGDSYTDGKSVVIGKNILKPKDFDVVVGLALHEASHIKLSDFDILKNLPHTIPSEISEKAIRKGVLNYIEVIKNIWNWVEDRRIDYYIFKNSPGYREYYRSMYDKYFNDSVIDKALQSTEYRDETVESYMFRIINLHNVNTDLNALKGLKEIYTTISLSTIDRLKSTKDAQNVAFQIFGIMLKNLPVADTESQDSESGEEGESSDGGEPTDNYTGSQSDESLDTSGNDTSLDMDSESMQEGSDSDDSQSKEAELKELTDNQKRSMAKKIQKQIDFLNGDVRKTSIAKKQEKELEVIEESGTELTTVGKSINGNGVDVVVVNDMTQALLESNEFPLTRMSYDGGIWTSDDLDEAIQKGIRIGKMLGKKLKVRSEERTTVFNRQRNGRIDKRMVASLGFGNENVFQYLETDSYKKANLHISVDASGSMGGQKWLETMTNIVALAQAVDMIPNLSIQISFRTTTDSIDPLPYVVLAYDSNKDKFVKIKKMFRYLDSNGTTPEGLCFEAIMDKFIPVSNDMDSYFINISDGMPWYGNHKRGINYSNDEALKHTRKMVEKVRSMGIRVLSYFVSQPSDYYYGRGKADFQTMYGKSAQFIDVTNVNEISKTMNNLFLEK